MTPNGYRLGIDFGTSNTVAVVGWPDQRLRPVLFDGFPLLPSAVFANDSGALLVGRDASHAARSSPERFEPNPKRRVDEGTVLLGDRELPVVEVIAAVLRRVYREATLTTGGAPPAVTLTFPAAWGEMRKRTLVDAARAAGLPEPSLVPEPVAAASYFVTVAGSVVAPGASAVVYDLGGGTFDASVVRRTDNGFEVLATDGLSQVGGLDLDAAIVGYLGAILSAKNAEAWRRLSAPKTQPDLRARRLLWEDVQAAKEMLSRTTHTSIHVPLLDEEVPLTREQFEQLARPILEATVTTTRSVIQSAGVERTQIAGLFLVGGASRVPLVSSLLTSALGMAPTAIEQPELVVAEGSLRIPGQAPEPRPVSVPPVPQSPPFSPAHQQFPPPQHQVPQHQTPVGQQYNPVVVVPHTPPPGYPTPVSHGGGMVPPTATQPGFPGQPGQPVRPAPFGYPWDPNQTMAGQRRNPWKQWVAIGAVLIAVLAAAITVPLVLTSKGSPQTLAPQDPLKTTQRTTEGPPPVTTGPPVDNVGQLTIKEFATLKEHTEDVRAVAFNNDGTLLASGAWDGKIVLWDVAKKSKITVLESKLRSVYSVEFSPDGKTLAAGGNFGVEFWNVDERKLISFVETSTSESVYSVSFSPDGKSLVSGDTNSNIKFWDVAQRKVVGAPITGHNNKLEGVAYSADGKFLISAGQDDRARVWDLSSRKQIAEGSDDIAVNDVGFIPNTNDVVFCGGELQVIRDALPSGPGKTPEVQDPGELLVSLDVSRDGALIATSSYRGHFWVYRSSDFKQVGEVNAHGGKPVHSVAFSADRKLVATGSEDLTVKIWEIQY